MKNFDEEESAQILQNDPVLQTWSRGPHVASLLALYMIRSVQVSIFKRSSKKLPVDFGLLSYSTSVRSL